MKSGIAESLWWSVLGAALLSAGGCEPSGPQSGQGTAANGGEHAAHDHSPIGPHGGDLIEFGSEALHAELVHAATGPVTVHLLAGDARTAKPLADADLRINLSAAGTARQFRLAASPDPTDPPGTCSRFVVADPDLGELLEHPENSPSLVLSFDGQQFRAAIRHGNHSHGHDEH